MDSCMLPENEIRWQVLGCRKAVGLTIRSLNVMPWIVDPHARLGPHQGLTARWYSSSGSSMKLLDLSVLLLVYLSLALLMLINDAPVEAIVLWGGVLAFFFSYYVLIPLVKLLLRVVAMGRGLVTRGGKSDT